MSDYCRRHGAAFALYHKKIRGCSPAPFGPVGPIVASAAGGSFRDWRVWPRSEGVVQL
jgi:hypothetical protein